MCEERGAAVIWIYSDFRDQIMQTFEYMIRILTRQLLAQVGPIPEEIWNLDKRSDVTLQVVQNMFSALLGRFRVVYLCIDALDECEPAIRIRLLKFINKAPSNLCLFCTARRNVELVVAEYLQNLNPAVVSMMAHEEDVEIYVTQKIAEDPDPDVMNESLREDIIATIARSCHGM